MRVSQIISEAEYRIEPDGKGKFNIVGPNGIVGSTPIRGTAALKAKALTAKSNAAPAKPSAANVRQTKQAAATKTAQAQMAAPATPTKPPAAPLKTLGDIAADTNTKTTKITGKVKGAGKAIYKVFLGSPVGKAVSLIITAEQIMDDLDTFATVYEANNCDINSPKLAAAQLKITDNIAGGLVSFFLVAASTAGAIATITRFFTVVPGFGWIVSLIGGGSGIAISYALGKLAKNTNLIKGISDFIANTMLSRETLTAISFPQCKGAVESIDETIESKLQESVTQIKTASKDMVMNDPKLLAMLKAAKAKAS